MTLFNSVVAVLPFRWPQCYEGVGSTALLLQHIVQAEHQRVLLVTDNQLVQLGLVAPIQSELQRLGAVVEIYDAVLPDPDIAQIEAGVAHAQRLNAEAILAVGGGSVIDAAKVIGARCKSTKSVQAMAGMFKVWRGMLPLFVLPTTAGTGSETTIAAVVSEPELQRKFAIMDLHLMPTATALDPELMIGLPPAVTAATGMDALTHAIESYLSRNAFADTREKSLEATRLIAMYLERAYQDGTDLEARAGLAKASHLAGQAFTKAGVGYVHAIAHQLGARYHLPHGLANAMVMPYVLADALRESAQQLAQLARAAGLASTESNAQSSEGDIALAMRFIEKIRLMNESFGIPSKVSALQEKDVPAIATAARAEARFTYAVPKYWSQAEAEQVVRQLLPVNAAEIT
ncbi:MAG: iron-containing alcohol dehydrogenase [Idiomarina sp.]|nr:iron-containing alcohol dehydrogenase [Idiomarina sp.]